MADFLIVAALLVLLMVALGLLRILSGPSDADRMMAAQLLGSGGVAALLLIACGTGVSAVVDVALLLVLLAAFAAVGFVRGAAARPGETARE
jgi:multicomponent Na+:H+ antiporter subunit F